jgi:hypothetical protein
LEARKQPTSDEFWRFDRIVKKYSFLECKTSIEAGYYYTNNYKEQGRKYTVWVWSSFLKGENEFRKPGEDAAWVIIVNDLTDSIAYCARYFLRTQNLLDDLLGYAMIAQYKVDHIHSCPCCGCPMEIFQYFKTRQTYWRCRNKEFHSEIYTLEWDWLLPLPMQKFLKPRREAVRRRHKEYSRQGYFPEPKRFARARKKAREKAAFSNPT